MVRRLDKKFNLYRYPGDDYRHLICDICGKKRFLKDMKHINDDYNRANGLTVCKEHDGYTDVQPQDIPIWIQPEIVDNPDFIRVRPPYKEAVNLVSNQLPTAPQQLKAYVDPISGNLTLIWLGPSYPGSSPIIGYSIRRIGPPQDLGTSSIVSANTNTGNTTFAITDIGIAEEVIYDVAAINEVGQGPYSNQLYWPYKSSSLSSGTLLMTNSNLYLLTNGGLYIEVLSNG